MGELIKLLTRFLGSLPFKKLSPNQTFDLCFDILAVVLLVIALLSDIGENQDVLKGLLIILTFGFIGWSFKTNT